MFDVQSNIELKDTIMKDIFPIISASIIMIFMVSCATLSKNECLEADWFEIGRRDGSTGKPRSIFQNHNEACLEHHVHADRQAYYKGREEGLKLFCTQQSGFEQGRRNRSYRYVCPPELESDFLAGYAEGKELYKYESKIASLEKRLRSIENQIQTKEKQLHSGKLSDVERAQIRSDLKYLDIENRDVIRELKYLEETRPLALTE